MLFPHCPNPKCIHFSAPKQKNWFSIHSSYHTEAFGTVQRYICNDCKRTFSSQTFSIDYYAKKVIDYEELLQQLVTSSGVNDISRHLEVSSDTVQNRCERLARSAMAIHARLLKKLPMRESMAADGLESFSFSQYYPNHINIFAGSESEFIYETGFANLRRKGRMTSRQKLIRKKLETRGRADPGAIEKSVRSLTEDLIQFLMKKKVVHKLLFTDMHRAYTRSFAKTEHFLHFFIRVMTSSRSARTMDNSMFPINYIDRQIRKDISDHVRETVKFAKSPAAMMIRFILYRHYHNCMIPWRVKEARKKKDTTHAEKAGITRKKLRKAVSKYWLKRAFLSRVNLGAAEKKTWLCEWRNPGVESGRYDPLYVKV